MLHIIVDHASSVLEKASWIAQGVIASATVFGAGFAATQLLDVRRSSQASLLLELDARFDSAELREARNLLARMAETINQSVATKNPQAKDAAKRQAVCREWQILLGAQRTEYVDSYQKLIGYMGFFETLGLMVKKKYVSRQNALDLFKGPLIDIGDRFRLHIEERCNEMGVSEGLFEHALKLSEAAIRAEAS